MKFPCETCEGHGQVITLGSLRQGHTHPNDPDRLDVDCEDCDGTGERDAVASDLDGRRARFRFATGQLTWHRKSNTLTLEDDNIGMSVVGLKVEDVICLS